MNFRRTTLLQFDCSSAGNNLDIRNLTRDDGIDTPNNLAALKEADLTDPKVINTLAWVIYHFLPLVADTIVKDPWAVLADQKTGLQQWATASDLAFTVLVLEHGINKWRNKNRMERLTGKTMWPRFEIDCYGEKYKTGIGCKEAKNRYERLACYFYSNFYINQQQAQHNMGILQQAVWRLNRVRDHPSVTRDIMIEKSKSKQSKVVKEVTERVLHEVYYYMNVFLL